MTAARIPWGDTPGGEAELITLCRGDLRVAISTYGGIVTSLRVPDRSGRPGEITLGYDTIDGYLADRCYFGCLLGRVANRVGRAQFSLDGRRYRLDQNNGTHHLHGGAQGFHTRLWRGEIGEVDGDPALHLSLTSPDGDQGYPGQLDVTATYVLSFDALQLAYDARCDAPTPVNLSSHLYFNLAGPQAGPCLEHRLHLSASQVQETDDELIPTGRLVDVADSPLDFRDGKPLGQDMDVSHPMLASEQGYDHSFVLDDAPVVARLEDAASGRRMEMSTDCPCVQLYSGNFIPQGLAGRQAETYAPYQGVCLEAQEPVDAVNQQRGAEGILRPGQRFERMTQYRFSCAEPL